ncbi:hypothetical protein Tco_0178582 [Tanacetum coccineum]
MEFDFEEVQVLQVHSGFDFLSYCIALKRIGVNGQSTSFWKRLGWGRLGGFASCLPLVEIDFQLWRSFSDGYSAFSSIRLPGLKSSNPLKDKLALAGLKFLVKGGGTVRFFKLLPCLSKCSSKDSQDFKQALEQVDTSKSELDELDEPKDKWDHKKSKSVRVSFIRPGKLPIISP